MANPEWTTVLFKTRNVLIVMAKKEYKRGEKDKSQNNEDAISEAYYL